MELQNILKDLKSVSASGMAKTASARSAPAGEPKVAQAKQELVSALNEAMTTTKTASAPTATPTTVVPGIMKMASDLATGEAEALVKEAHLYGAAVADGFMSRLGQFEQAAPATAKTAGANSEPTEAEFAKFASENPDLTKQAIELGYYHGKAQVEQLKTAAFQQGYADAGAQIGELSKTAEGREKLAALANEVGGNEQTKIAQVLEKLAQTPEGREKLAAVEQGYKDAAQEIEKIASDCFTRGYSDTANLLRAN